MYNKCLSRDNWVKINVVEKLILVTLNEPSPSVKPKSKKRIFFDPFEGGCADFIGAAAISIYGLLLFIPCLITSTSAMTFTLSELISPLAACCTEGNALQPKIFFFGGL